MPDIVDFTIKTDWTPSPEEVEREFARMAAYFENTGPVMLGVRGIAQKDTKERFDTETDPGGNRFQELDDDYLRDKIAAGYPETILTRTGDLSDAAPDAWVIAGNVLFFDTAQIPDYGTWNNDGTGDSASWGYAASHRAGVRAKRAGNTEFGFMHGSIHQTHDIGSGNALPSRPFIGLSPYAAVEIEALFLEWVHEGLALGPLSYGDDLFPKIGETGLGQPIIRGPFGPRFGRVG